MIKYDYFWIIMKRNKVSQYKLIMDYHISPATILRLKRNQYVSLFTIETLCRALDCNIGDIVTFV
ncbi:MAG: helix-turn-helix transcriptional regulator [Eubacteriales bacterium]|nr:helix-turn-helix transcriptional regulator [Eubacteriales bacterium]